MSTIKKRSAREMVQFLSDNLLVDASDLQEVFFNNYAKCLSNATSAWFGSNNYGVYSNYLKCFVVDTNLSIAECALAWKQYIIKQKIAYNDFLTYAHNQSMFNSGFTKTEKPNIFKNWALNSDLVQLIMTLQGRIKYQNDYSEAHELMDKIGIAYNGAVHAKIGHLQVKTYLNGRFDIIGMTDEQRAMLDNLFSIHEKLKNR